MEDDDVDIVSERIIAFCAYCFFFLFVQFNAVSSASSTSDIKQPAKEWNYGRPHSSTANKSEYFCFISVSCITVLLLLLHRMH
jgi:hypothetical protein